MEVTSRDLMTYAFVSHDIFEQKDILTGLLPFFKPFLAEANGELFNPDTIAARVRETYKWNLNADVIETLIPRLAARGWIERVKNNLSSITYICKVSTDHHGNNSAEDEVAKTIDEIGGLFLEFTRNRIQTLFSVTLSASQLKEMLLWWLVEKRAFDRMALLQASEIAETLPALSIGGAKSAPGKYSREEEYLCRRFIQYAYKEHPYYFEKLVRIAAVALVAEVALAIKNPSVVLKNANVRACFDAPFVMTYLGLSGESKKGLSSYIVDSLKKLNIRIEILNHSCEEIRQNLSTMLSYAPSSRFGPTAAAIKQGEVLEAYAHAVALNVEQKVQSAGFEIINYDPRLLPNEHGYFTEDQIDEFAKVLPWDGGAYGYSLDKEQAKRRDALSVAYVVRKRRGKQSPDFFKCHHVFISQNGTLCRYARNYCRENCALSPMSIGPAVHQRDLAAILWLALGTEEKIELSRQDLIASCASIVSSNPEVIEGARKRLKEIRPEHAAQIDAILSQPKSIQLLLDLTLGGGQVTRPDDLERVFTELKQSVAEEVVQSANEAIKKQKEKHKKALSEADQKLSDVESAKQEIEYKLAKRNQSEQGMLVLWLGQSERFIDKVRVVENCAVYLLLSGFVALSGIFAGAEWHGIIAGISAAVLAAIPSVIAGIQFNRKGRLLSENILSRWRRRVFMDTVKKNKREDLLEIFIVDFSSNAVCPRNLSGLDSDQALLERVKGPDLLSSDEIVLPNIDSE